MKTAVSSSLGFEEVGPDLIRLIRPLTVVFRVKDTMYRLRIDKGFESDGSSGPFIGYAIFGLHPFHYKLLLAAVVHDALFKSCLLPRRLADKLYYLLAKQRGAGEFVSRTFELVLKVAGKKHYKKEAKGKLVHLDTWHVKDQPIKNMKDPYEEEYVWTPNYHNRTIRPKFIVLHHSCGTEAGDRSWIVNSKSKVSYHYLVNLDGSRIQFVFDTKRAWHAGAGQYKQWTNLNSHSIGIAVTGNTYKREATKAEIDSVAHKCIYLMEKFGIDVDDIVTHRTVSPDRKDDTSPDFLFKVKKRIDELLC